MKKITAVVIGAGNRGEAYGSYALENPSELQFVAVAEPDRARREKFQQLHGIKDEMCFDGWETLLKQPKLADAAFICTQDGMHYEPAVLASKKGYHILLEKPMSNNVNECIEMGKIAKENKIVFSICHVLRYTNYFSYLKRILNEGKIGELVSIQHNENVSYWHHAHSFVRGNWRNSKETSPMILAKSCHDIDLLLWLAGADCVKVSSFGGLFHFKEENAPKGAPKRCLDGCPAKHECPYYAPKMYLTKEVGWPTSTISNDSSIEARTKALKEGPYGRCVYFCDNDVVDHQVVNFEFANGVTASFTMSAFTYDGNRTFRLMGTKGEIKGTLEKNEIEINDFLTGTREVVQIKKATDGHSGGDFGLVRNFIELVQKNDGTKSITSADLSVQSHVIAFAAEKSRLENKVIFIKDFMEECLRKEEHNL